jgi:hypothetical protein
MEPRKFVAVGAGLPIGVFGWWVLSFFPTIFPVIFEDMVYLHLKDI